MGNVMIGHASISEHGTIRGTAGDQNSKEVCTRKWYKHSKGWYLIRCIDEKMRLFIAEAMEKACANDDIGYDQSENQTLWDNIKSRGFDPSKTTKKVETDCARLVRVCCQYACEKVGNGKEIPDFYTASLASKLVKTGLFTKYSSDKYCKQEDYLMRGDILVTRSKGHTCVVLSYGDRAAPVQTEEKAEAAEQEDAGGGSYAQISGSSVNIRSGPGTEYEIIHVAHRGERFELEEAGSWLPVKHDGRVCWVSAKYAQKVQV